MRKLKDSPTHVSRAPSVESPLLYSHPAPGEGRKEGGREGGREGREGERGRRSKQRREEGMGGIERGWVRGKG